VSRELRASLQVTSSCSFCFFAGYSVRGTVRSLSPSNAKKNAFLIEWQKKYGPEKLELFEADLSKEGSFDKAIEGCDFVIHAAAPVFNKPKKDPIKEIVEPAIQGVHNVFQSARKAHVKRVVMTSSVVAIENRMSEPGKTFNEETWNNDSHPKKTPYAYSKTQGEKAAWKYVEELPKEKKFELVTICPDFVEGPILNDVVGESALLIARLMDGEFPALPKINFGIVHVHDVARAHILAMESSIAAGNRYLITSCESLWFSDISALLHKKFAACRAPTTVAPNFLAKASSLFDPQASYSWMTYYLSSATKLDNSKAKKDLGMTFIGAEQSVLDTAQSLIDRRLLKKFDYSK